MEKQAKIFISYSRKDKEIVKPLVEKINKALNTKCWVDLNDIPIGSFLMMIYKRPLRTLR